MTDLEYNLRLNPVVDQNELARQLEAAQRQAEAEITFRADGRAVTRELQRLDRQKRQLGTTPVRVNVDVLGDEDVREVVDLVARLDQQVATIDVNSDRSEVEAVFRLAEQIDAIRATVDVDVQAPELQQAFQDLDRLGDRITTTLTIQERGTTISQIRSDLDALEQPRTIPVELDTQGVTGQIDLTNLTTSVQDAVVGGLKATGPIGGALAALGLAGGAVLQQSLQEGLQREADEDFVAAQFLLDPDEAREVGEISREAFNDGFGTEPLEVAQTTAELQRTLSGITEVTAAELEALTEQSLAITRTQFQSSEIQAKALAGVLTNDLAPSAQDALDVFAFGLANTDARGEDLLETFAEYSNQLSAAGVSAEQFVSLAVGGLEAGARSTDGIADATKELTLGLTEDNEEIRQSIQDLGVDYNEVLDLIDSGQGFEAIQQISGAFADLTSETEKQRIAQIILRGTYEQIGVDAFESFSLAASGLEEIDGSAQQVADTLTGNAQSAITQFRREFDTNPVRHRHRPHRCHHRSRRRRAPTSRRRSTRRTDRRSHRGRRLTGAPGRDPGDHDIGRAGDRGRHHPRVGSRRVRRRPGIRRVTRRRDPRVSQPRRPRTDPWGRACRRRDRTNRERRDSRRRTRHHLLVRGRVGQRWAHRRCD